MTHEKLAKSPITYVLAQVQFTNIESMKDYIPKIQENIRPYFPIYKEINISTIELRGNQLQNPASLNQWHFMDKENVMGILLDNKSITIHTSRYDQFNKITESLTQILTNINEILNISLFVRLGVRYINVIKSNLSQYIQPTLLGFHLEDEQFFDQERYLSNTELIQKSKIGIIKIKSTCISSKEIIVGGQNFLVPYDLVNGASNLSFEHNEQPKDKFLILDIDHYQDKQEDFETSKVISNLIELQEAVYQAFLVSITPRALADWK